MAKYQSATIDKIMQQINSNECLLPSFQREYVWLNKDNHRVEELFDSIMRNYPISSMLFWEVKDETKGKWQFYKFIEHYEKNIHNEIFDTKKINGRFNAVLDGQQRLTSFYLALYGHYVRENKRGERKHFLYFNLTQNQPLPEDSNVEYEFAWLNKTATIYTDDNKQKWFKVGDFYKYKELLSSVMDIQTEYSLEKNELNKLALLWDKIFREEIISYYLEDEQEPDKAVNIFIRFNANGEPLKYSDILFSIAIAEWKTDARKEINNLVDEIRYLGFNIDKDLILKSFLYLFHNNIGFKVKSFDKQFVEFIEVRWQSIKNCFIATFKLLRIFGLEAKTLSANYTILPILYFIYHKNLTNDIVTSKMQEENRNIIKKWLLRALIFKPFGGSADTVLTNTRKAFIEDFKQYSNSFFDSKENAFPLINIEEKANYRKNVDSSFETLMKYRKDKAETFAILSFLYPHLDYKNNDFHKDHLHAQTLYEQYKKMAQINNANNPNYKFKTKEEYDSLPNLQMLDANENMSKKAKTLKEWVEESCKNKSESDRKEFLEKHLIPDIDLSLENFDEFYEVRKKLLIEKLKEILN